MQSYIRAVYEQSTERGHLCPCSTVRDIRTYTNELIKKRKPKFSNKQIKEATDNTIVNAGQVLQERQRDESWKALSVKDEKLRIKKFISTTLEDLIKRSATYDTFKAEVKSSSTPKKPGVSQIPLRKAKVTPNIRCELLNKQVSNKKGRVTKLTDQEDPFKTPDRKIIPKVASESKFFIGMVNYDENGKVVIDSPIKESYDIKEELASVNMNSSMWLTPESHSIEQGLDPADSPFNHGFNSIQDSTISEEDLIQIEAEQNEQYHIQSDIVVDDSMHDSIDGTPKRDDVDLEKIIKRLEQHFTDVNSSLKEESIKHSRRKRADSLSTLHSLIDKMVPESLSASKLSPQIRKRSNSLKNSQHQISSTPVVAQHYLTAHTPLSDNTPKSQGQMFNPKCRNLLETIHLKAKALKFHLEEDARKETSFNNSINKIRIDSMFHRATKYKALMCETPSDVPNVGRKRADSLNFDSLEPTSSLEQISSDVSHKNERRRLHSLNLDNQQSNDVKEKEVHTPDGIINKNVHIEVQTLQDNPDYAGLTNDEKERIVRMYNKIDEMSARIKQMKLALTKGR